MLLVSILHLPACSPKTQQVISAWQSLAAESEPSQEWASPLAMDKKTSLEYGISNDETNLYLSFQTTDPVTRMKILRTGLELKITSPGNSKGPAICKYPVPEERITLFDGVARTSPPGEKPGTMQRPGGGGQNPPDPREMFQRALAEKNEMLLQGFLNHPNGMVALDHKGGVHLKVDMNAEGLLAYQITVPLNTLIDISQLPLITEGKFLVEIILKGIEIPAGPPGGYGSPGMGGGRSGGGMRPGFPIAEMPNGGRPAGTQGRTGEFSRMSKDERLHIAFRLAAKP